MGEGIIIFYDPVRLDAAVRKLLAQWKLPAPPAGWRLISPAAGPPDMPKPTIFRYIETDVPRERNSESTDWLYYALIGREIPYWEFRRRSEKTLREAEVLRVEVWT